MGILIRNILSIDKNVDIYIEGNLIKRIGEAMTLPVGEDDKVIDGTRKAIVPGFVNGHTHSAMTLFRGFGDDMPLMPWLEERIWPNEAKMTREDIYWGTKLACLEMIKSGTTTFFDMYQTFHGTASAAEEMGMRGVIAGVCFDHFQDEQTEKSKRHNERLIKEAARYSDRIRYAIGPHAPYTVSGKLLRWCHQFAVANDCLIHLHLAETEGEVVNAVKQFGLSPVRYLNQLGILSPHLVVAHCIHVDEEEIQMLADNGVKVVHNPASNMKLASGIQFKFKEMKQRGILVGLGTDGCSSSNNLDMIEVMKLASLLGKGWRKDPEALAAGEMLQAATQVGADILELNSGRIEEGRLADLCLIDMRTPVFTPNFNFVSNLVYAANGSCVDTVICDGKILMENKRVPGEDEIMEKATEIAYNLVNR